MFELTELCQELRNWFDRGQPKWFGTFEITDGVITAKTGGTYNNTPTLQHGQYFRIVGSVFNDGVHQFPDESIQNETFNGAIWAMAVPPTVIALKEEIAAWQEKYGRVDNAAMSPYSSESFAGYSYSKSGGGASSNDGTGGNGSGTWQAVFSNRLKPYRKLCGYIPS